MAQSSHVLCVSTVPDEACAREMARAVVEGGLCACVNVLPGAKSIYLWEGAVQESAEVVCLLKAHRSRVGELRTRWVALHPYECPEFIELDVTGGHAPYLAWLDETQSTP